MVSVRPVLEVLTLGGDLLAVASAFPARTGRFGALYEDTLDALVKHKGAAQLEKRSTGNTGVFQLAVAILPDTSFNPKQTDSATDLSLFSVWVSWYITTPRPLAPPVDILQQAVALWTPFLKNSTFAEFTKAYSAVKKLSSR
jgi:hypothetical protein